ncbi:MAG: AAC(3) family N-acetyltransferase [Clostridia bacterium]|nr:AAC(3) family N-acetyltransferase [Clostridia bacterium]
MNSFKVLVKDLKRLGLKKGDVVIVHSSLSAMGNVDGGANTVIDALLKVLGKKGTLLFPAFSYTPCLQTKKWDYYTTPSCVGTIPETFRKRKGVLRSVHPTHSVCALGKFASEMVSNHYKDDTPVGENSPFRQLSKRNGKILMLGCSLHSNSFMHGVEEMANVSYVLGDSVEFLITDKNGNTFKAEHKKHNFVRNNGTIYQRYDKTLSVLSSGDYLENKVHGANCVLINAKALETNALSKMKEAPLYFIDDPDNILN